MIARGAEARQTRGRGLGALRRPFTLGLTKGWPTVMLVPKIRLFKADHPCDSSPGQFLMKPRCFILVDGVGSVKKE
jgi:hypothetical protein